MSKKRLLAKALARTSQSVPAAERPDPVAEGFALFQRGNYREALQVWEKGAPPPAATAEAFFRLGLQQHAAGKERAALAAWHKAALAAPDRAVYHFHCGLASYRLEDTKEAAACFRRALALAPDSSRILFHIGLTMAAAHPADGGRALTAWLEGEGAGLPPPQEHFLRTVAAHAAGREVPPVPPGRAPLAATHLVHALARDPGAARPVIGEALSREPENTAAWQLHSLVLAALGDPDTDRVLQQALARGGGRDLVARVTMLKKWFVNDSARRGDLAAAVAALDRDGKASPAPVDPTREKTALLLTRLGNELARREAWDRAADCWRRARAAGSRDLRLLHNLALASELMGQPDAAAAYWRRTIDAWTAAPGAKSPRLRSYLATAYRHLAELEAELGHYEGFVTDLELTARYAPEDVEARLELARAYMAGEEDAKGMAVLEEVLRLAPENPDAITGLALAYLEQGDWQKAEPLLTRGLTATPDDPQLRGAMGRYYVRRAALARGHAAAISWLIKSVEITPDKMPALARLAVACYLGNRKSDWNRYRDQALAVRPGDPEPYFRLGQLFLANGHPVLGKRYLKQGLALSPDDARAQLMAADMLLEAGMPKDAGRYLKEAAALSPDPGTFQEAADICGDHEEWELGVAVLEEAHRAFPADPDILLDLAGQLFFLHRYSEAHRVLMESARLFRLSGVDPASFLDFRSLKNILEEEVYD